MSAAEDSPAILVARFLRSNNYNEVSSKSVRRKEE